MTTHRPDRSMQRARASIAVQAICVRAMKRVVSAVLAVFAGLGGFPAVALADSGNPAVLVVLFVLLPALIVFLPVCIAIWKLVPRSYRPLVMAAWFVPISPVHMAALCLSVRPGRRHGEGCDSRGRSYRRRRLWRVLLAGGTAAGGLTHVLNLAIFPRRLGPASRCRPTAGPKCGTPSNGTCVTSPPG